jgi:hypothetical protein
VLLALPDIPLRTAPFSLADRWLLWSKARLYTDRLELSGWGLRGRYWRRIPFEALTRVEHEENCLVLHVADDTPLRLRMSAPSRWHAAIVTHRSVYEG